MTAGMPAELLFADHLFTISATPVLGILPVSKSQPARLLPIDCMHVSAFDSKEHAPYARPMAYCSLSVMPLIPPHISFTSLPPILTGRFEKRTVASNSNSSYLTDDIRPGTDIQLLERDIKQKLTRSNITAWYQASTEQSA